VEDKPFLLGWVTFQGRTVKLRDGKNLGTGVKKVASWLRISKKKCGASTHQLKPGWNFQGPLPTRALLSGGGF